MEGTGVVVFCSCPPRHFGDRVAVSIHAFSHGAAAALRSEMHGWVRIQCPVPSLPSGPVS